MSGKKPDFSIESRIGGPQFRLKIARGNHHDKLNSSATICRDLVFDDLRNAGRFSATGCGRHLSLSRRQNALNYTE